jgi:hypothetical protein
MRAESQTRLRPRAHALTTEIARMLVHPSATQAVALRDLGRGKSRRLKVLQHLQLIRDEARKTPKFLIR